MKVNIVVEGTLRFLYAKPYKISLQSNKMAAFVRNLSDHITLVTESECRLRTMEMRQAAWKWYAFLSEHAR